MNIYEGLLFMQGHIASVELAKQLAETPEAPAVSMAADAASEGRRAGAGLRGNRCHGWRPLRLQGRTCGDPANPHATDLGT
jgi:hypothetical protein